MKCTFPVKVRNEDIVITYNDFKSNWTDMQNFGTNEYGNKEGFTLKCNFDAKNYQVK